MLVITGDLAFLLQGHAVAGAPTRERQVELWWNERPIPPLRTPPHCQNDLHREQEEELCSGRWLIRAVATRKSTGHDVVLLIMRDRELFMGALSKLEGVCLALTTFTLRLNNLKEDAHGCSGTSNPHNDSQVIGLWRWRP